MIDLEQSVVIELYIKAFLVGVAFGVLYDVIRFFKLIIGVRYGAQDAYIPESKAKRVAVYVVSFVTDTLFWLLIGVASVLLFYNVSGGVFRGSVYPCLLFGLALYYFSLGRLTLALSRRLIALVHRAFSLLGRLVAVPLRVAKRAIFHVYHLTIGKIIVKIKGKIIAAKERRRSAAEQTTSCAGEEEQNSEDEGRPYKKYGRIRF